MIIIKKYARPESIMFEDCWQDYCRIANEYCWSHETANHSESFINEVPAIPRAIKKIL